MKTPCTSQVEQPPNDAVVIHVPSESRQIPAKFRTCAPVAVQRRYDIDAYLRIQTQRIVISYCRVSSFKQRDDLKRQVQCLRNHYPQAKIIKDIGSGLNFKRKGYK